MRHAITTCSLEGICKVTMSVKQIPPMNGKKLLPVRRFYLRGGRKKRIIIEIFQGHTFATKINEERKSIKQVINSEPTALKLSFKEPIRRFEYMQ